MSISPLAQAAPPWSRCSVIVIGQQRIGCGDAPATQATALRATPAAATSQTSNMTE
jgi:hypothetical protein